MNNLSYITLSDAVNANKQIFDSVLRNAFCHAVSNLTDDELKKTFFPELQANSTAVEANLKKAA